MDTQTTCDLQDLRTEAREHKRGKEILSMTGKPRSVTYWEGKSTYFVRRRDVSKILKTHRHAGRMDWDNQLHIMG